MKSTINHFRKIALLTVVSAALWSCEDKLNIEPLASLSPELALANEGGVQGALVGAYDGMQSATLYGGEIQVLNDVISNTEDINFTGTFAGLSDAYNLQMVANNTFATGTWAAAYNTVNRANTVLGNLDKVTSSAANKSRVEGEALFIRSAMFFELVRLFAKYPNDGDPATNPGIPLILQATTDASVDLTVPRNSVKEVYDKVIADLVKAESLLPASQSNSKFVTKWAAAAMLSRVHLMNGNYAEARDAANRVITGSGRSLATTFPGLWFTQINLGGNAPNEYLFFMDVTNQDGINQINTYFGRTISTIPGTAGRSDCKIKATHLAKYEAGDARNYFILSSGFNYTQKHLDRFGDVPVIRLAEMYLTRAEANFRLNTTTGATPLEDVNRIRTRAGLPNLLAADLTLNAILKERYLELAFEGHNLPERRRLKQNFSATSPWNDPKTIMPIPQREMDVNKKLVQNAGY